MPLPPVEAADDAAGVDAVDVCAGVDCTVVGGAVAGAEFIFDFFSNRFIHAALVHRLVVRSTDSNSVQGPACIQGHGIAVVGHFLPEVQANLELMIKKNFFNQKTFYQAIGHLVVPRLPNPALVHPSLALMEEQAILHRLRNRKRLLHPTKARKETGQVQLRTEGSSSLEFGPE